MDIIIDKEPSKLIYEKKLSSNCFSNYLNNKYIKNNNRNNNKESSIIQLPIERESKSFSLLLNCNNNNNNNNNNDNNDNNFDLNFKENDELIKTIEKNGPDQNQILLLRGLNINNLKLKLNLFKKINNLSNDLILKLKLSNKIISKCFSNYNKEIMNSIISIYYETKFNNIKFINFNIILKDRSSESGEIILEEFDNEMKSIIDSKDFSHLEINNSLIKLLKTLEFKDTSVNSNDSILNEIVKVWNQQNQDLNFESLKNYIYYNDISPTEKILKIEISSSKKESLIKLLRSQSIDILLKSINQQFSIFFQHPDSYQLNLFSKLSIIEVPSFISNNSLNCNSLISNYFNDIIQNLFYRDMGNSFNIYGQYPSNYSVIKALGSSNGLLSIFDSKNLKKVKDKIVFSEFLQKPELKEDLFIFNHDAGCIKSSYNKRIYKDNLIYEPSKVFSTTLSSIFSNYQSDIQLFKSALNNLNLESSLKVYAFNIKSNSIEESLKLSGVYSILELPITKFINRLEFTNFNENFQDLLNEKVNFLQDTKSILESSNIDPSNYSIGEYKLFINEKAISELKRLKSNSIQNKSNFGDVKYSTPLKTKLISEDNRSLISPISQSASRSFNGEVLNDSSKTNKNEFENQERVSPIKKNLFQDYENNNNLNKEANSDNENPNLNQFEDEENQKQFKHSNSDEKHNKIKVEDKEYQKPEQPNYIINNTFHNYFNTNIVGDEETNLDIIKNNDSNEEITDEVKENFGSKNVDINDNSIIIGEYSHLFTLYSNLNIIQTQDVPKIEINRHLVYLEQYLKLKLFICATIGKCNCEEVKEFINSLYLLLKKSNDQELHNNLFKTNINEYILTFLNMNIKKDDDDDDGNSNNQLYSFIDIKMISIISNYLTVVPYNQESFVRYYSELNGIMAHLLYFKTIALSKDMSSDLYVTTENLLKSFMYITSKSSVVKSIGSKIGWLEKEGVNIVALLSKLFSNLIGENFWILIIKITKNILQCKEFNIEFFKTGLINNIVKKVSKGYLGIIREFKELFIEIVLINSFDNEQLSNEMFRMMIQQFQIISVSLLKYILNMETNSNSFLIVVDCLDTLLENQNILNFVEELFINQNHSLFFSCLQLIKNKNDGEKNKIQPLSPSTDFNHYKNWRIKLTIDQIKLLNERCDKKLSKYYVEWESLKSLKY